MTAAALFTLKYDRLRRAVDYWAASAGLHGDEADDLYQDAMLRLWKTCGEWIARGRTDRISCEMVVRSALFRQTRKGPRAPGRCKVRHLSQLPRGTRPHYETVGFREPAMEPSALETAIAALPPRQRQAIRMVYFESGRMDGVAAACGISKATLKQHLHRGKARLREALATN